MLLVKTGGGRKVIVETFSRVGFKLWFVSFTGHKFREKFQLGTFDIQQVFIDVLVEVSLDRSKRACCVRLQPVLK